MDTLKVGMKHTEEWEITEDRTTQRGKYPVGRSKAATFGHPKSRHLRSV